MDDLAYNPTLRPLTDVGTEPSIVLQGRAKPRSDPETSGPTISSDEKPEPAQEAPVSAHDTAERLTAAGFVRKGGAWQRRRFR